MSGKEARASEWQGSFQPVGGPTAQRKDGGFFLGDILQVDLTAGTIQRMPVTRQMAMDFIGGQGIGSYLLTQYVKPGVDPLGPDNALILSVGALVGTPFPSASRSTFLARSPTRGGYLGMSNGGGMAQLRNAGFDHLVVLGRASHPVYLKITDDQVDICDARHLWGKDTYETAESLWSELGAHYDVAAIGPSGENLVRHAAIIGDKHVAWGRTGLGAVMGSKRLKAIAVSGSGQVQIASPTKLLRLSKASAADITGDEKAIQVWRDGGTWKWSANWGRQISKSPRARSEVFDLDIYDAKLEHHPMACPGCPVGCKHTLKVRPGLKHAGLEFAVGCTSGTMCGPFGQGLGVVPIEEVAKCAEVVQRLGMDSSTTAGLISLLIELYEAGIVTGEDTGGLELRWGDEESILRLMHMLAKREGIGDLLAEGASDFCRVLGRGAERYRFNWKGMARAATSTGTDMRGLGARLTTNSLAWAVNFRGHGDRHRYPYGGTVDQPASNAEALWNLAAHMGIPEDGLHQVGHDPEKLVPWAMRYVQDYNTVAYALGFCDRPVILNALPIQRMAEAYKWATGLDVSPADLLRAGRRIWNMEKVWVSMQGQTRKDDLLGDRMFSEEDRTVTGDGRVVVHRPVDRDAYDQILRRYYEAEEWDGDTGLPKLETLQGLGLDWMVDDYKAVLAR